MSTRVYRPDLHTKHPLLHLLIPIIAPWWSIRIAPLVKIDITVKEVEVQRALQWQNFPLSVFHFSDL